MKNILFSILLLLGTVVYTQADEATEIVLERYDKTYQTLRTTVEDNPQKLKKLDARYNSDRKKISGAASSRAVNMAFKSMKELKKIAKE